MPYGLRNERCQPIREGSLRSQITQCAATASACTSLNRRWRTGVAKDAFLNVAAGDQASLVSAMT